MSSSAITDELRAEYPTCIYDAVRNTYKITEGTEPQPAFAIIRNIDGTNERTVALKQNFSTVFCRSLDKQHSEWYTKAGTQIIVQLQPGMASIQAQYSLPAEHSDTGEEITVGRNVTGVMPIAIPSIASSSLDKQVGNLTSYTCELNQDVKNLLYSLRKGTIEDWTHGLRVIATDGLLRGTPKPFSKPLTEAG